MDFFDKLSSTIISTGKDVTKKTKDLTDVAKLKIEIHSLEDDIKRLYEEIGRAYYLEHKDDEEPEYGAVNSISTKEAHVKMLKKNVMELRKVQSCPKCGREVKSTDTFCSICGEKLGMYEEDDDVSF